MVILGIDWVLLYDGFGGGHAFLVRADEMDICGEMIEDHMFNERQE